MKIYILLLFCLLISCSAIDNISEKTELINIKIINESTDDICYHLFFENIKNSKYSFGINQTNKDQSLDIKLIYGSYNVYIYGLINKTDTTKKVYSYQIIKENKFFNNSILNVKTENLEPQLDLALNEETNDYNLTILVDKIFSILYISSISIKQGTLKTKSLKLSYVDQEKKYITEKISGEKGVWLLNISFGIKTKIDKSILTKDNITISTTNFTNIVIGEFYNTD
ncbi:MAG: hypothetical protein A2086_06805 [Spirochaetes bacterium GWD1_27_9]|nr:MAG: hypothetical protein A2086_06805 [Spirochaetes bacterium GWD1_27_9]